MIICVVVECRHDISSFSNRGLTGKLLIGMEGGTGGGWSMNHMTKRLPPIKA